MGGHAKKNCLSVVLCESDHNSHITANQRRAQTAEGYNINSETVAVEFLYMIIMFIPHTSKEDNGMLVHSLLDAS